MIGYGLAFVVGYLVAFTARVCNGRDAYPWSIPLIAWGFTFMGLNYLAGLW